MGSAVALLLQDLVVTPAVAPAVRAVRIGPALSKALYQSVWLRHDNHKSLENEDADDDSQQLEDSSSQAQAEMEKL